MMKTAFGVRCAYGATGRKKQKTASGIDNLSTRMQNNLRAIYRVMLTSQIKKKRRYCYRQFPYSTTRFFRAW
jgi:hypothetical protein